LTGKSNKKRVSYLNYVKSHLDIIIDKGTDVYGKKSSPMWMSSIDIRSGTYPEDDLHPEHIGKRVYRNIDAPSGSSLYWDQPSLIAANNLSKITGDPRYNDSTDQYVKYFLEHCVADNGIFLWGNHYYYNAFEDEVYWFIGTEDPKPCDMENENGSLHEARPIPPAWDIFWKASPEATERCIRKLGEAHIFDKETGAFNRHADGKLGCAFLESGGILVETLCWLYNKTLDKSILKTALRIARYSWNHRSTATGLLENNPTMTRWDKYICTTEVGLWAGSLIRAARASNNEELLMMARESVLAYLKYGYDEKNKKYYGRLNISDGSAVMGDKSVLKQRKIHEKNVPSEYSDIWEPLFPTHDYPMSFAQACVHLYKQTCKLEFKEAIERWALVVAEESVHANSRVVYAEQYGRCIHFLAEAAIALKDERYFAQACHLADEAIGKLFDYSMFRGHTKEDRYDAVDGVGYLLLALIYLETRRAPDYMGFGF